MKVLNLKNVCKTYSNKSVLKNINFDVYKGDIIGLVGPNGAGKTTLFKILASLISIDSGEINKLEEVSGIISKTPLYPFLTGKEHLKYISKLSKYSGDIKEIEEFINIGEKIDCKVKTYSLGMKQRLCLGIVLLNNSNIIILDEPTNGLDAEGIIEFRNLIKLLSEEKGKTILISSHNLDEIEKICTKIIFLNRGEIIKTEDRSKDELTNRYILKFLTSQIEKLNELEALCNEIQEKKGTVTIKTTEDNVKKILKNIIYNNIDFENLEILNESNLSLENKYFLYMNKEEV